MPRALGIVLALITVASAAMASAASDGVGMRRMAVLAPERGGMLDATVWNPAAAGGRAVLMGDNAVFQGAPARQDAPVADSSFPLVLLAHGGLRSAADSGAWIAARAMRS